MVKKYSQQFLKGLTIALLFSASQSCLAMMDEDVRFLRFSECTEEIVDQKLMICEEGPGAFLFTRSCKINTMTCLKLECCYNCGFSQYSWINTDMIFHPSSPCNKNFVCHETIYTDEVQSFDGSYSLKGPGNYSLTVFGPSPSQSFLKGVATGGGAGLGAGIVAGVAGTLGVGWFLKWKWKQWKTRLGWGPKEKESDGETEYTSSEEYTSSDQIISGDDFSSEV